MTATRYFAPSKPADQTPAAMSRQSPGAEGVTVGKEPIINPWDLPPKHATLAWPLGEELSMQVYLTTSPYVDPLHGNQDLPHFTWDHITFGDWKDVRSLEYDIQIPAVRLNSRFSYPPSLHLVCRVSKTTDPSGRISSSCETAPPTKASSQMMFTTFANVRGIWIYGLLN